MLEPIGVLLYSYYLSIIYENSRAEAPGAGCIQVYKNVNERLGHNNRYYGLIRLI